MGDDRGSYAVLSLYFCKFKTIVKIISPIRENSTRKLLSYLYLWSGKSAWQAHCKGVWQTPLDSQWSMLSLPADVTWYGWHFAFSMGIMWQPSLYTHAGRQITPKSLDHLLRLYNFHLSVCEPWHKCYEKAVLNSSLKIPWEESSPVFCFLFKSLWHRYKHSRFEHNIVLRRLIIFALHLYARISIWSSWLCIEKLSNFILIGRKW